jgi:hypothetical protein
MKMLIEKIKARLSGKKLLVASNNYVDSEQPKAINGDLVPLIWMIEKLRKREGGCTMNELIKEVNSNFKGVEHIKHRSINYK